MNKNIISVLKCTVYEWLDHRGGSMGAALAFYTLFSIAPVLVLVNPQDIVNIASAAFIGLLLIVIGLMMITGTFTLLSTVLQGWTPDFLRERL